MQSGDLLKVLPMDARNDGLVDADIQVLRADIRFMHYASIGPVHEAISHYSDQALARQLQRIAEIRTMSDIMGIRLEQVYRATSAPSGDMIVRSRKIIEQSRDMIRLSCAAGEDSAKRIERSRALLSMRQRASAACDKGDLRRTCGPIASLRCRTPRELLQNSTE
ncbi:hypothetical protein ABN028_32875 [Actinopolymorpha sp. B17G11]|uniref:hypothetical protein n=1 Tax=Actinopolymorpha sp. B17G11 TaxID=3160861 RepID=UPI0032E423EB